jgi:hypothetical protein
MRTVKNIIKALKKFPPEAKCYAYEGETFAVVVVDAKTGDQLGLVFASESSRSNDDDSPNDEGPE